MGQVAKDKKESKYRSCWDMDWDENFVETKVPSYQLFKGSTFKFSGLEIRIKASCWVFWRASNNASSL